MSNIDDMVKAWLLDKFVGSNRYITAHGPRESLSILNFGSEWECGCYSEYTRDDVFVLRTVIATQAGNVNFTYGQWGDLPSFIEELDAYNIPESEYCGVWDGA